MVGRVLKMAETEDEGLGVFHNVTSKIIQGLRCSSDGSLVEDAYICDGYMDCETEVDERICDGYATHSKVSS